MAKSFPNTGVTIIDSSSDLTGFSPSEGLMVFQKDTNELKIYDGSNWVSVIDTDNKPMDAWTSWTPSLSAGFSNGNATRTGGYLLLGKTVFFWGKIVFGSTTGKGAQMNLTLPLPASAGDKGFFKGLAIDVTVNWFLVDILPTGNTSQVELVAINAGGTYGAMAQINANVPFTWDTNDVVRYGGVYEAA